MKPKKIILISAIAGFLLCVTIISPIVTYASTYTPASTLEFKADIIEWRYKTENNKIYRRQYNYSKQVWIGEWEFVANVVNQSSKTK